MKRKEHIDMIRGILIILVVLGHFGEGVLHHIIFLFHMPLFLILSGYLYKREKLLDSNYILKKINDLMLPYICYMLIDFILIRRDISFRTFCHMLWGGRAITGIYWYVTCFLFSIIILALLLKKFSDKTVKWLIFIGGGYQFLSRT